ncbi:hypothetical protein SAMN02745121_03227 [Nannocystis exedens]|uniref:Zinc protease n=1 Tax=Nannocystis exedens TaxID=54 RepID=A0A1I1YCJ3_9BACT|nr:insulinase family protein [Nannocystis exedens]PCC71875.1 hypothetical protein NAEX_04954 [Nannocystis exedens]SFE15630.1 hypothetical protein SAMN02745121_03227 [Nannocystis exedens]
MLVPRRPRALGAALALLGLCVGEPTALAAPAAPTPAPTPAAAPAAPTEPAPKDSPATGPDTVLDVVLPSGLRVLAARDLSLPVAAVVLAVETGSEDDPPEHPGLVHALAYHLHQGNRELRPGEAIAAAQDAGGVHLLATGPGQIRFESLVPISRLGEVLFAESQRLRFPTVDKRRWDISLGWAGSDVRSPAGLRPTDLAAVHGAPGLGHDGRAVDRSLADLSPAALAAALAAKFSYTRATLIVVAPEPPEEILDQVRARFADLPPAARALPVRPRPPARAPLPPVAASGKPPLFAWPVPADAASSAWAGAICRALNRQKPTPEEPRKSRIGCDFDPDPRRAALVLRAVGAEDPAAFVRARLARLGGPDQPLLVAQAQFMAQAIRLYARTALGLARLLAASPAQIPGPVPVDSPVARRRDDLLGLASLAGRPGLNLTVEDALLIGPAEPKP